MDEYVPPAVDPSRRAALQQVMLLHRANDTADPHDTLTTGEEARLHERATQSGALEQRQALAHDLHDSAMQTLFSLHLAAHAAVDSWERDPVQARGALEMVLRLIHDARMEMHALLFELRENVLASDGLICALERYVELIHRHSDLRIGLQLQSDVRMPPHYQEGLYRMAREGITNVIKHAQAGQASIILTADEAAISMRVEDDGVGFREAEPECASCGLRLLRERVLALGGTLHMGNRAQGGAFLEVTLPLP